MKLNGPKHFLRTTGAFALMFSLTYGQAAESAVNASTSKPNDPDIQGEEIAVAD